MGFGQKQRIIIIIIKIIKILTKTIPVPTKSEQLIIKISTKTIAVPTGSEQLMKGTIIFQFASEC